MKKIIFITVWACLFLVAPVFAQTAASQEVQQTPQVDYGDQEPIDMDLDGLTDQAEIQIYKTDSNNPDTDADGYFDGAEVIVGSDPANVDSTPVSIKIQSRSDAAYVQVGVPWGWYIARAAGLVGFIFLYISIFLGLTLRLPFMRKYFAPASALNAHCWISLQATILALIHGGAFLFDEYLNFSVVDILVPFSASFNPTIVALGTISFYLMVILVATSYARKYISFKLWRAIHFLNIILYVFTIIHAYVLGTDMKNDIVANVFIYANVILIWLMIANMYLRIKENIARKRTA